MVVGLLKWFNVSLGQVRSNNGHSIGLRGLNEIMQVSASYFPLKLIRV